MGREAKTGAVRHAGCAGPEVNFPRLLQVHNLAIISLGSNLGDSRKLTRAAIARLQEMSAKPLLKSSLWETTPVDCPPGSPMFVNAVVALTPIAGETP